MIISAQVVLSAVLHDMGGIEPVYEKVATHEAEVEYSVMFEIPSHTHVNGTLCISILGLVRQETTQYEIREDFTRHALNLLQHEHGINVVFYNSLRATQCRETCASLVEKFKHNKDIFELVLTEVTWR